MEEKKKFKLVSSKKTRYLLPNILTLAGVCLGISSIKKDNAISQEEKRYPDRGLKQDL